MSLVFSESTNKTGMYELFQDLTQTNTTTYPIAKFTRDANNAYANFKMLSDRASGTWQNDDTNQTDYPIIKLNLVSGQRDYPLTVDGSSTPNQILDIMRVDCAVSSTGNLQELIPYDQTTGEPIPQAYLSSNTGIPYRYDKLANAIFLDPTPNFSSTAGATSGGMWVYINRTPVYFLSSDTTKKPGIPDFFHEYLVYRPAYFYCVTKLPQLAAGYLNILQKLEQDIAYYYAHRNKDERKELTSECIRFR